MEPALINPHQHAPLINSSHGGHAQQPMDGHFPVGLERFGQPSSPNNQSIIPLQKPLIDIPDGSALFPEQQSTYGLSSVGLGYFGQQQPFASHYPGAIFHHPGGSSAGQELPSITDLMLRCSQIIHQLVQRLQYQHQQTLPMTEALSTRSAMAAAPSSSQPTEQKFEVRISRRPKQASSDASRDSPFNNCLDHGHVELHEGGRKSSTIQKGRKLCNNVTLQRGKCDVEFGRTKSQLQLTAVSDTSIVNGKQFGSPTSPSAVSVPAATGKTQQLTNEFSRDVIIVSPRHRKIVTVSEKPAKRLRSDDMNDFNRRFRTMLLDPFSCHMADSPASAVEQENVSAETIRQLDQCNDSPASYVNDAVDQTPNRSMKISNIIPICRSMCVLAQSNKHLHKPPRVYGVHYEADSTMQLINHHSNPSAVEALVKQIPPWPPPESSPVLLVHVSTNIFLVTDLYEPNVSPLRTNLASVVSVSLLSSV